MTLHRSPGRSGFAMFLVGLLWILGTVVPAQAQPTPGDTSGHAPVEDYSIRRFHFGVAGGPRWTLHNAAFPVYFGSPECGVYQSAWTGALSGEFFFEAPFIQTEPFRFVSSLQFSDLSVGLQSDLDSFEVAADGGPTETYTIFTRYRYQVDVFGIGASAGILWEASPMLRVGLAPGVTFLVSDTPNEYEEIVEPLGSVFQNNQQPTRPVFGGAGLEFRSLFFDLNLSVSGRVPIGNRLALYPQLRGSLPLNGMTTGGELGTVSLQALLGIGYEFGGEEPVPPPLPPHPPVPPVPPDVEPTEAKPYLAATVEAYGIDMEGERYQPPVIEIEEAPWTEVVPLIPFVYFERGSSVIPERYEKLESADDVETYSVDSLLGVTPLKLHWQVLNVVGERLYRNPEATVTVSGARSVDETEAGLAAERAESVRRYLTDVWQIDPDRVMVDATIPLQIESDPSTSEGREEQRNALIRFGDRTMVEPVIIRRMARIATPPAIRFNTDIVADTTISYWEIRVFQGQRELLKFDGRTATDAYEQEQLWSLAGLRVNNDTTPVRYRLLVRDITGQEVTAVDSFQVIQRITQRAPEERLELYEYNVVGFQFDSAELLPVHIRQLEQVAEAIEKDSQVEIIGYTDRLGDSERNQQLSRERARNVQRELATLRSRLGLPEPRFTEARGAGSDDQHFDNNLPEGRVLSRMVQVLVSRSAAE